MFNSTLMDFDLGLFGSAPADLCNNVEAPKTLAQQMEEDKKLALTPTDPSLSWLESTSDLQAFMDLGELPEVDDKDALINEVEEFLKQHEGPEKDVELPLASTITESNETLSEDEMAAAESLLDELLKSSDIDLNLDSLDVQSLEQQPSTTEPLVEEKTIKIESQDDSGFFDMSNVSKVITADGQEVLIMIAPASPVTTVQAPESIATSGSVYGDDESDPDPEWCPDSPESPKTPKGRPPVKRTSTAKRSRKTPYISDKKERKKQQNVEAARRYRDKKKAEQSNIETEEQVLANRNKALKSQVAELEAEMKTMKKLMIELGILKQK